MMITCSIKRLGCYLARFHQTPQRHFDRCLIRTIQNIRMCFAGSSVSGGSTENIIWMRRRHALSHRWKFEAGELERASPELSRVINTFAASPVGKAVLQTYGKYGIPADPMSLGIVTLWEEIVRHSAIGPLRAEALFGKVYADWSATGLDPDEAFLRRFAQLCLAQADRLKACAGANSADNAAVPSKTGTSPQLEGHKNER